MKRQSVPGVNKHLSPAEIPERWRNLLVLEPATVHELMNLLQVITSHCELLELGDNDSNHGLRVISEAAFKIRNRLTEQMEKSA